VAHLVSFRTDKFDVRAEAPNPINPIAGQSLLKWLRDKLSEANYAATEPSTEDWGWYIDVRGKERSYLVGASADAENPTSMVEWIIQIHKHRSLREKILGQNRMAPDDPLVSLIETFVRGDSQFHDVSVDRNA
jgi:hypothetical protein